MIHIRPLGTCPSLPQANGNTLGLRHGHSGGYRVHLPELAAEQYHHGHRRYNHCRHSIRFHPTPSSHLRSIPDTSCIAGTFETPLGPKSALADRTRLTSPCLLSPPPFTLSSLDTPLPLRLFYRFCELFAIFTRLRCCKSVTAIYLGSRPASTRLCRRTIAFTWIPVWTTRVMRCVISPL